MCSHDDRLKMIRFERDRYRDALEKLQEELNTLANEKEEERFNQLWLIPLNALDRKLVVQSAAAVGLLADVWGRETE